MKNPFIPNLYIQELNVQTKIDWLYQSHEYSLSSKSTIHAMSLDGSIASMQADLTSKVSYCVHAVIYQNVQKIPE